MIKAKKVVSLNVPAEKVWSVISQFQNVQHFHPLVEKSPMLSQHNEGVGAKRRCEFYDKTSVVEEITHWEEGRSFTVELTEASMPLKKATASLSVRQINKKSSEISLEMDYVVKGGPLGWVMGTVMMRPMMQKMFTKVLKALEYHCVTGKLVGKEGAPANFKPAMA